MDGETAANWICTAGGVLLPCLLTLAFQAVLR